MQKIYDAAVIGLGITGAAALDELARRGAYVIGLEAYHPGHGMGSSHGDTRLIRLGYFEDPAYVPLLHRAYRNWRSLEERVQEPLLHITGVLHIGKRDGKILKGTGLACEQHGLVHEWMDADQVRERFPVFALQPDEAGLFEHQGGYLLAERSVNAFLKSAAQAGASLQYGQRVLGVEPGDGGVTLRTEQGSIRARKVVVATGAWIAELVPQLREAVSPIRVVVSWFQPRERFLTTPHRMPVFLREDNKTGEGSFFGFPMVGSDGIKMGRHAHFREPIANPDAPNAPVCERDLELLQDAIDRYVPGAGGIFSKAMTCRYTMTPTENFLMDLLPGQPNVVVASPCSGHGFKFGGVTGEILADLALDGGTDLPIGLFSFDSLHG